jgi:hypothetical protein
MDKDETDVSAGSLFDQFRGRYLPRLFIFTSAFTIDVVEYWVILMGNLKMHIVKSFVHRRSTKFVLCLLLTFKFECLSFSCGVRINRFLTEASCVSVLPDLSMLSRTCPRLPSGTIGAHFTLQLFCTLDQLYTSRTSTFSAKSFCHY